MAPRLKVFVTSDGLTDYVVATSSKAKALAAWGLRQDVFKQGAAHETDDPALMKAALARAGEVLRRPAGTRGELAKLKNAKAPAPAARPTPAQRKKVADLERQLAAFDIASQRATAKLERERLALDRKAAALQASHAADRAKLEAALSAARRALG